mgnify:CR=1 FL=1
MIPNLKSRNGLIFPPTGLPPTTVFLWNQTELNYFNKARPDQFPG